MSVSAKGLADAMRDAVHAKLCDLFRCEPHPELERYHAAVVDGLAESVSAYALEHLEELVEIALKRHAAKGAT